MMLRTKDALVKGCKHICIQSLDTDVLVILLEVFPKLQVDHNITDIVLQTRKDKEHRKVGIKSIAQHLGQELCQALQFLHFFQEAIHLHFVI